MWEYTVNLPSKEIWNDSIKVLPYLNEWLKTQRWAGLSSINDFKLVKMDEIMLYRDKNFMITDLLIKLFSNEEQKFLFTYHIPLEITQKPKKFEVSTVKLKCEDAPLFLQPAEINHLFFELILKYSIKGAEMESSNSNKVTFQWYSNDLKNKKIKSTESLGNGGTTNTLFKMRWSDNSKGVCKIFRILTINPEIMMLSNLYSSGFRNVPQPFGSVSINIGGETLPLMLFSEFIESIGDGGTYFWGNINEQLTKYDTLGNIESAPLDLYCTNLGEIVSNFHYHSATIDTDFFTPEILTQADITKWKAHIEDLFKIIYQNCNDILFDENPAQSILDLLDPYLQSYLTMESWNVLEGTMKIKIHQDLHLSQMLTSSSSNGLKFTIIDFEGDPMLPPEDKFQKDPIFRDLAAICSAFHYIKFNALAQYVEQKLNIDAQKFNDIYLQLMIEPENNSLPERSPMALLIRFAQEWQTQCQRWFIESYLHQSRIHNLALNLDFSNFPEFQRKLYLFQIERLIKELYYESLFRKSNLIIPIIGLLENFSFNGKSFSNKKREK